MTENVEPVFPRVPSDFTWRIDFDWHHLADFTALDDDDSCANTAVLAAAVLASSDVFSDEGVVVGDICPRNDMC